MAKRITRKPATRPVPYHLQPCKLVIELAELPGAVFYEDARLTDIDDAIALQAVRARYESDDCQEMLWADCRRMGFDSEEISRFAANPAAITKTGFGFPIGGTGPTVILPASLERLYGW